MDSPKKTLSPPLTLKSISPIRRSGSPYRRRQIAQLEQGFREKRQKVDPQSSPAKHTVPTISTETDETPLTQKVLAQMANALDKVATTFSTTASQLRDTKSTQTQTLEELVQLRSAVEKLLEKVDWLVEREKTRGN